MSLFVLLRHRLDTRPQHRRTMVADGATRVGSTDYFINQSDESHLDSSSARYWEPHTSSIDFCETNYLLSDYVVELHNAWSSLWGLSLFGLLGILFGNPTRERMFDAAYAVLVLIGLGSAALHSTLHWAFQGADELPMIYLVVCGMYCCLEINAPRDEAKYPRLPMYLSLLCGFNTAIYLAYREYYIVFLATFVAMLLAITRLHLRIAWTMRRKRGEAAAALSQKNGVEKTGEGSRGDMERIYENSRLALRFYAWHYAAFVLVATPVWFLDQFWCRELLPLYNSLPAPFKGTTLHVVWHACSGLGAFFFVQFLAACRVDALGMTCRMGRAMGALPVVMMETPEEVKNSTAKRD